MESFRIKSLQELLEDELAKAMPGKSTPKLEEEVSIASEPSGSNNHDAEMNPDSKVENSRFSKFEDARNEESKPEEMNREDNQEDNLLRDENPIQVEPEVPRVLMVRIDLLVAENNAFVYDKESRNRVTELFKYLSSGGNTISVSRKDYGEILPFLSYLKMCGRIISLFIKKDNFSSFELERFRNLGVINYE